MPVIQPASSRIVAPRGHARGSGDVRLLTALVLLLLLPGAALALVALAREFGRAGEPFWAVLAGALTGLALERYLLRHIPGLEVLEHEFAHALAALLFCRRITRFKVSLSRGGQVAHTAGFGGAAGDDFIGFAPYVLPTFTAVLVLLRPLLGAGPHPYLDVAVGLTLGYHTGSTAWEVGQSFTRKVFRAVDGSLTRTDLGERGLIYSLLYILTVTLAIHGLLLAVFLHGYRGVADWARLAASSSWHLLVRLVW